MTDIPSGSTRVFTTALVLAGEPIVWVAHDGDGDWQFFSETPVGAEDGRIAHLQHLLDDDPTLGNVLHIPAGFAAARVSPTGKWIVEALDT